MPGYKPLTLQPQPTEVSFYIVKISNLRFLTYNVAQKEADDDDLSMAEQLGEVLNRLLVRRLDITRALYSQPSHDIPKFAKHEPFSYAALNSAEKDAQTLYADFNNIRQRLDSLKVSTASKNAFRALGIDLEFFIN